MPQNKKSKFALPKSSLFILAVLAVTAYVVLPKLHNFRDSLAIIRHADLVWVCVAALFMLLTYLAGTLCYLSIGYYKLRFWRTALIQLAFGFTSRILPAGSGGIATNVAYLMKQKTGSVAAVTVVGLVNIITVVGHIILFGSLILLTRQPLGITAHAHWSLIALLAAGLLVVSSIAYLLTGTRKISQLQRVLKPISLVMKFVITHPVRLLLTLLSAIFLTVCYALTLYAVMLSLNVHTSLLQAFYVLTVGVAAIALTPTPGGVGGAEAGLVAAQASMGVAVDQALSVALLYRLLTFWIPMVPGFIAFRLALKRGYLN